MRKYLHKQNGQWVTSKRTNSGSIPGESYLIPKHLESEPDEALYIAEIEDDTGQKNKHVVLDTAKAALIKERRREAAEAERRRKEELDRRLQNRYYGTISHEDLEQVKSFDDLKRYIRYLLDNKGVR